MLRNILAGSMTLLTGAFGLLLLAAIVFSCRQNADPHHRGEPGLVHTPVTEVPQNVHLSVRSGEAGALDDALVLRSLPGNSS